MKYQSKPYSCGAAVVLNVSRCYGKRINERLIRSIAETTPENGTDENGIIQALNVLGLEGEIIQEENTENAITKLKTRLPDPTIICTQNLQHWVAVIAATDHGARFVVIDSSNTIKNTKENGIHVLTAKELKKIWQSRNGLFFGIHVKRKRRNYKGK